ncbi:MAG: hypothetical protein IJ852_05935 [Alphaproteobacteria bacterium]|nr:hypothetical protein [Alphaproteobacteria bacterium]
MSENRSGAIQEKIEADSCDDRLSGDDLKTAENRATDKASLAAVKLSGVIQKYAPDINVHSLDLVTYRIVDEYLSNITHNVTFDDENRICVRVQADLTIAESELEELIHEYKRNEAVESAEVVAIAERIQNQMKVRPHSEQDRKLVYIAQMQLWNGDQTNHYTAYLSELLSHSEYYYITPDESLADFTIKPELEKADVDELDAQNHKMHMIVKLNVTNNGAQNADEINDKQNHFILFKADEDEQKVADKLIVKLLNRAVTNVNNQLEKNIQNILSQKK